MSDPKPGHNQLKSVIERINRLEDQKKEISQDISEVYLEAKGNGLNPAALRAIVKEQRADKKKREALQADIDAYMAALGAAD